jgi:CheY-like chemotaxis protein/HPt (histidine-containing phosphotransfer) domain-containing protein
LFRSFTQVDASTTRQYGGTGLGLAISKRLSELMGGSMWVESVAGQGSTFHFTLVADSAPCQARVHLRGTEPRLAGKRVLIVDDNATNRRIVTLQVQSWGMVTRAAASGPEALEWIRAGEPFDIALLDMQMPEMDGMTLAAEIRRYRDRTLLPLVVLSSVGRHDSDSAAGDAAGIAPAEFAAFLNKPIKAAQLFEVLISIFGGQPGGMCNAASQPQIDRGLAQRLPLRILLAEDNAVNQKVAMRMLSRLGYRADLAANGLEVLEALRRQSYDVVLMDVQMPEMDGIEATRRIRQELPKAPRPRIVAMTASALEEDRHLCLEAGMDDYIRKPVRIEELQAALERAAPRSETGAPVSNDGWGEVIDPQVIASLRALQGNGDPDILGECLDAFVQDTPVQLAAMRAAIQQRDAAAVRRGAHSLKGSSATLGACRMLALCKQLEATVTAGALAAADASLSQLEAEFEAARDALNRVRAA